MAALLRVAKNDELVARRVCVVVFQVFCLGGSCLATKRLTREQADVKLIYTL